MDRLNRPLTSADIEKAKAVMAEVYVDENYPMFINIAKDTLANIDTDNTLRITNWRFEVNTDAEGSIEYKELSDCLHIDDTDLDYHIVIGQA